MNRNRWLWFFFSASFFVLAIEVIVFSSRTLQVWQPFDYSNYVAMGNAVRQGLNPYGAHQYYPLPTAIWIFVPLSLLPDAFRFIWILGPIVSILILFRRSGVGLFLFTPLWAQLSDAMLDGWLLVPLAWLLENRAGWAGLGAAIVLFKPQLAWLLVVHMLLKWCVTRNWKNLSVFFGAMLVFYIPSFIVDPTWVFQMLGVLSERTTHTTTVFPLLAGSIWSWWWLSDWARGIFLALLLVALGLFVRAMLHASSRAAAFHLINLVLNPILFGSSMLVLVPTLRERKPIFISVAVSLGAFVLDRAFNGFGGGYALLPILALYWQGQPSATNSLSDQTL